jgi:hypothetical protein
MIIIKLFQTDKKIVGMGEVGSMECICLLMNEQMSIKSGQMSSTGEKMSCIVKIFDQSLLLGRDSSSLNSIEHPMRPTKISFNEGSGGWCFCFNAAQHVDLNLFFTRVVGQNKKAGGDHFFVKSR